MFAWRFIASIACKRGGDKRERGGCIPWFNFRVGSARRGIIYFRIMRRLKIAREIYTVKDVRISV